MNTDPAERPLSRRALVFVTAIMGGPDKPGHDVLQ
jgi:hypothetical protein